MAKNTEGCSNSWDPHTDHIFNQFPGQIKYLGLYGPDGGKWGGSGTDPGIAAAQFVNDKKSSTDGLETGVGKYMFLRQTDEFSMYNKGGEGAALLRANSYAATAFAAEGFKAEQCVTCLEKFKNYMSSIGYN